MSRGKKNIFTFQSYDFGSGIHNGAFGGYGTTNWIGCVCQVHDDHLRCLANLFAYADELVALHRERGEGDIGDIDTDVGKLQKYVKF